VVWTGLFWLRFGISGRLLKHGNKRSRSMKYLEIFEKVSNWWLLKENSAPWR
jgi:hypothetical protein